MRSTSNEGAVDTPGPSRHQKAAVTRSWRILSRQRAQRRTANIATTEDKHRASGEQRSRRRKTKVAAATRQEDVGKSRNGVCEGNPEALAISGYLGDSASEVAALGLSFARSAFGFGDGV
jgi:hypothetical protein